MTSPDTPLETPVAPPSAGQMLRAAREAKGLHLAMLSVKLKVSVRQLEALEADRYDELKGLSFVRALAQAVSRQLGIDPAPVLAAMPQVSSAPAIEPTALDARRQASRLPTPSDAGQGLSRQVLVLAALMLVGVAALIWWPGPGRDTPPAAADALDAPAAAVPLGQASDPVTSPAAPASGSGTAPAVSDGAAKPPALPAPPEPVASAPLAVTSANASAPLLIRVRADAWVEVRDAQGQMPVKRIVKAGETLQLSPTPPLFVYLGKADSAELRWQGQPVDLQPHTRNNEARLQIKP